MQTQADAKMVLGKHVVTVDSEGIFIKDITSYPVALEPANQEQLSTCLPVSCCSSLAGSPGQPHVMASIDSGRELAPEVCDRGQDPDQPRLRPPRPLNQNPH